MDGAVEVQRTRETQRADLAFVDLGDTGDEIFNRGVGSKKFPSLFRISETPLLV